jgi:hypothetical protein
VPIGLLVNHEVPAHHLAEGYLDAYLTATGITVFLLNVRPLEAAQRIACHSLPTTPKLDDRSSGAIAVDAIKCAKL